MRYCDVSFDLFIYYGEGKSFSSVLFIVSWPAKEV